MTDLSIAAREAAATPTPAERAQWLCYRLTHAAYEAGRSNAGLHNVDAAEAAIVSEISRLTAALATAQAEGFEAGKEAAARVCDDTAKMWRSEARATNRRDYATNELTMAAVYETAARNIRALKRGDR